MEQDKLNYLKRQIKRTYKRYTGERNDGKATLIDVLKLFNIYIDEARLEDYMVETIDYSIPSIKVLDKKTYTTYEAKYTDKADLLNYWGGTDFVNVICSNPNYKLESLYYIGSNALIVAKMTFTEGDYELTFEKEMGNSVGFGLDAKNKFAIRYTKNVQIKNQNAKQLLLSKIFMNKDDFETLEQNYTYSTQHFIKYDDQYDKYCYNQKYNTIYGVNDLVVNDLIHYLHGICFESTNVDTRRYLPYSIDLKDFSELSDKATLQSAIVFRGGTDNGIHHAFKILKTKNQSPNIIENGQVNYDIYLDYVAIKWNRGFKEDGRPERIKTVVAQKRVRYPRINDGNITSQEIKNIIKVLDTEFEDNIFIQTIINELKTFTNKMDIRNGLIQEEFDPLSPKLFINKTFDEISTLISTNKDDYFKLIREQFENATNINKDNILTRNLKKD